MPNPVWFSTRGTNRGTGQQQRLDEGRDRLSLAMPVAMTPIRRSRRIAHPSEGHNRRDYIYQAIGGGCQQRNGACCEPGPDLDDDQPKRDHESNNRGHAPKRPIGYTFGHLFNLFINT
jgi:hypothetical protein